MRYLQMIVTVPIEETVDHRAKMDEMLQEIPGDGDFADVAWSIDGNHLDDEGDPL